MSIARHVAHALLVLIAAASTIAGGFFHCVSGGTVSNRWGFVLTEKTRWGYHDQFVDLNAISTWNVSNHRATVTALVRDGWATINAPAPAWCYRADDDRECLPSQGSCEEDRRRRIARRIKPRPSTQCSEGGE